MPRLPVLALLLALVALALGLGSGFADEAPPGKPAPGDKAPEGKDDKPAEPDDGADDKIPFFEEINRALEQGVLWLKAKPKFFTMGDAEAAHWGLVDAPTTYGGGEGAHYRHPAGPTALALYTLLKCGVDPKDPLITQGFHWLRADHIATEPWDGTNLGGSFTWNHTQAGGSYELSAMILALTAKYDHYKRNKNSADGTKSGKLKISNKEDLEWLRELVNALVERRGQPTPESLGPEERQGWRYNQPTLKISAGRTNTTRTVTPAPHGVQDLSSTQLAVLALYSAHRFGVKAPPEVWEGVLAYTLRLQEKEGPERKRQDAGYAKGGYAPLVDHARGFCYIPGSPDRSEGKATGSMTGCGLATLLIAKEVLCETEKGRKEFLEKKYDKTVETAINDAIAWLDLHWSSFTNPQSQVGYHIYYLYSVERAMDIIGKNLIGKHLWYTEGARAILDNAKKLKVQERLKKGTREAEGMYWETGATHDPKDVLDTCFALLFLKRATKGLIPPSAPVTGGEGGPSDNR